MKLGNFKISMNQNYIASLLYSIQCYSFVTAPSSAIQTVSQLLFCSTYSWWRTLEFHQINNDLQKTQTYIAFYISTNKKVRFLSEIRRKRLHKAMNTWSKQRISAGTIISRWIHKWVKGEIREQKIKRRLKRGMNQTWQEIKRNMKKFVVWLQTQKYSQRQKEEKT